MENEELHRDGADEMKREREELHRTIRTLKRERIGIYVVFSLFVILVGVGIMIDRMPATDPGAPGDTEQSVATEPGEVDWLAYTLAEVAEHDNEESCWMVLNGKVYDFTSQIAGHPAGTGSILSGCGTDATERFERIHTERTQSGVDEHQIGVLAE